MSYLFLKKRAFIVVMALLLMSCNFNKSNVVYDSYLGDKSLVLYIPFNEKEETKEVTNLQSVSGSILFDKDRFGNENSSAKFSGKQYLTYGDRFDMVFSGKKKRFSFSFWIQPNQGNANVSLISKNSDSNCGENERQFNIKLSKDYKIQFIWMYNSINANGYRFLESNTVLNTNKWHNIVITYDGHSNGGNGIHRVSFYINGVKEKIKLVEKRGRLGDILNKKAQFAIGTMVNTTGQPCTGKFFIGSMDDVMIFKRILTRNEIEHISSLK